MEILLIVGRRVDNQNWQALNGYKTVDAVPTDGETWDRLLVIYESESRKVFSITEYMLPKPGWTPRP